VKLLEQGSQYLIRERRQTILGILEGPGQLRTKPRYTLRHDQAELREQSADVIDQGGAVRHHQAPRTVHHQHCLLLLGLHSYAVHVGAPHRLADCLSVVRVVLTALAVRGDELLRDQLDRVPELTQCPRPTVSASARLNSNQARRRPGEVLKHFAALHGTTDAVRAGGACHYQWGAENLRTASSRHTGWLLPVLLTDGSNALRLTS